MATPQPILQFDQWLARQWLALALFTRARAAFITFLVAVGLLSFTFELFNFSLTIDSENHAYAFGAKGGWVAQGRWGMYFLNYWLLPDAVMPFTPNLVAILGCLVGVFFFVHTLTNERGLADYLAAPLAVACPTLYFAFSFTTLGYGVGVAFAVVNLGLYALTRWRWTGVAWAVPLFAFGIGVYQAVLPLVLVLFGLYLLAQVTGREPLPFATLCRRVLVFGGVFVLSYALYEGIKRWSLWYVDVPYDAGYMTGFVKFQPSWDYLQQSVYKAAAAAVYYYTGHESFYIYNLTIVAVLFATTLLLAVGRLLLAPQTVLVRLAGLVILGAVLAAPFVMHVMNAGFMPTRTALAIPYVFAGLAFLAAGSRLFAVRVLVAVLVLACFYKFTVVNNRYSFSNHMVWQADRELTVMILDRLGPLWGQLPDKSIHSQYPLELVGTQHYFETPVFVERNSVGSSFYKWAAGDVDRVVKLLWTMGVFDYRSATREERLSVAEQANKMPIWPREGSVAVINGVFVIKLGDYNPGQLGTMCVPRDITPFCQGLLK